MPSDDELGEDPGKTENMNHGYAMVGYATMMWIVAMFLSFVAGVLVGKIL